MSTKMVLMLVGVFVTGGYCEPEDSKGLNFVLKVVNQCFNTNQSSYCLSEKAARVLERAMDWNIQLLEGMTLARNNETINHRQARLLGPDRLYQAIENFFRTHVISLELGEARKVTTEEIGLREGDYGGVLFNSKAMKKEKKYMQYAFMVLLGIFGLTGPLVMKILALMAAKSLLAAKAALIIVGSVALKKLFEKDHREEPIVQVHTIDHDEEDHDRIGYDGNSYTGESYNSPYSSYWEGAMKSNRL